MRQGNRLLFGKFKNSFKSKLSLSEIQVFNVDFFLSYYLLLKFYCRIAKIILQVYNVKFVLRAFMDIQILAAASLALVLMPTKDFQAVATSGPMKSLFVIANLVNIFIYYFLFACKLIFFFTRLRRCTL